MDSEESGKKMIEAVRGLSVKNAKVSVTTKFFFIHFFFIFYFLFIFFLQCKYESDREKLIQKVDSIYISHEKFENFAKFSTICLVVSSLFVSPAVYSDDRIKKVPTPLHSPLHLSISLSSSFLFPSLFLFFPQVHLPLDSIS